MIKIKKLFSTPKKAIITTACAIVALAAVGAGTTFAVSAIAESTSIGAENAQNFAFADAGIDPTAAENVSTTFAFRQGQFVYEVEFTANDSEYDYWIKAADGSVVKKEIELVSTDGTVTVLTAQITMDAAKEIALEDAGLTSSEVTFTKAELDLDDDISVYELEFYTETYEYDYEINAETGDIYSRETKAITVSDTSDSSDYNYIGLENAKSIALEDSGLSESDVTFTKAKLDTDDETYVYDIEFYTSTTEYEYEINATTGSIVSCDTEAISSSSSSSSSSSGSSSYIGLENAKSIALEDSGLSESDVTFTKAKLDTDDETYVYDIEFYTSTTEYEYEINATTGSIVSCDTETISSSSSSSSSSSGSSSYIGVDKAKTIALNHAGLSSSSVTFSKAKLDKEDGIMVYEIEFYSENMEYEYTINATTGVILEYESEYDD